MIPGDGVTVSFPFPSRPCPCLPRKFQSYFMQSGVAFKTLFSGDTFFFKATEEVVIINFSAGTQCIFGDYSVFADTHCRRNMSVGGLFT